VENKESDVFDEKANAESAKLRKGAAPPNATVGDKRSITERPKKGGGKKGEKKH